MNQELQDEMADDTEEYNLSSMNLPPAANSPRGKIRWDIISMWIVSATLSVATLRLVYKGVKWALS